VVRHFKQSYSDTGQNSILEQVSTVQLFPCYIEEIERLALEGSCTKEEIQGVLKGFAKDKSHGPDGWTVEFFLLYFDLVGMIFLRLWRSQGGRALWKDL
jgi:hypothetical protein